MSDRNRWQTDNASLFSFSIALAPPAVKDAAGKNQSRRHDKAASLNPHSINRESDRNFGAEGLGNNDTAQGKACLTSSSIRRRILRRSNLFEWRLQKCRLGAWTRQDCRKDGAR